MTQREIVHVTNALIEAWTPTRDAALRQIHEVEASGGFFVPTADLIALDRAIRDLANLLSQDLALDLGLTP